MSVSLLSKNESGHQTESESDRFAKLTLVNEPPARALWSLEDALQPYVFHSFINDGGFQAHVKEIMRVTEPQVSWPYVSELLSSLSTVFTTAFLAAISDYYHQLGHSPIILYVDPISDSIFSSLDWVGYKSRRYAAFLAAEAKRVSEERKNDEYGNLSGGGKGGGRGSRGGRSGRGGRGKGWEGPLPVLAARPPYRPTRWLSVDIVPRRELTIEPRTTSAFYDFLSDEQPTTVMLFHGTRLSLIDSRFRDKGVEPPKLANALSSSEALYLTNSPVHALLQVSAQQPIPFPDHRDPASLLVFRLNTKVLHGEIPPTAGVDPFNVEYFSDTVSDREALCEETMYNLSLKYRGRAADSPCDIVISKIAIWSGTGSATILEDVVGFNEVPVCQIALLTPRAWRWVETCLVEIVKDSHNLVQKMIV